MINFLPLSKIRFGIFDQREWERQREIIEVKWKWICVWDLGVWDCMHNTFVVIREGEEWNYIVLVLQLQIVVCFENL